MSRLLIYPKQMKKNLELTRGLIYSQRVMLTLIDKGLSRKKAYQMVQRNAMKVWKGNKSLLTLLKNDPEVTAVLPATELEPLFDYQYYLRYVDEIFERLGLTRAQWKGRMPEPADLTPGSI